MPMQAPRVSGTEAQTQDTETVEAVSNDTSPFSCNVCHRSYTRIDHLARHFRSHTREKPFTCSVCNKDFARADLLKRHATNHKDQDSQNKRQKISQPTRPRISQACTACAEAKLRCEGPAPCRRCQQKGIECTYPEPRHKPARSRSIPNDSLTNSNDIDGFDTTQQYDAFNNISDSQLAFQESTGSLPTQTLVPAAEPMVMDSNPQLPTPVAFDPILSFVPSRDNLDPHHGTGSITYDDLSFADFLKDIAMPNSPLGDGQQTRTDHIFDFSPKDVLDFNVDTRFDIPDIFEPAQPLLPNYTFQPGRSDDIAVIPNKSGYTTPAGQRGISLGAQAFKESVWLFTPAKDDYGGAEQINLSLPSQDLLTDEHRTPMEMRIGPIDRAARDRILAMILGTCDPTIVPRVVQSFPSAELLTILLHNFLGMQSAKTDQWIHVSSFDPSLQGPESLATFIAAGAVVSPLSDVRKLGFALYEASRDAFQKLYERDNRETRNLKTLQANAVMLDIGLWSGDRRKMEIAESFAQPLITMMRRGGRFKQPRTAVSPPEIGDDERTTEYKWHQWVEAESFRRLAFHLLIRDCHTSVSLLCPPLISYAEFSIDMPASADLWHARNANEWKDLYLRLFNGNAPRLPSLRTCIDDISPITAQQHLLDINLAVLIVLSGLWALTWQYREMTSAVKHHKSGAVRNTALITNSMYQEISQLLLHFKMVAIEWTGGMEPVARVLYERQLMHLHASLEDIQLIAGKEGEEEARRVFPLLGAWADSRESRLALWHAGQVIRAARDFRHSALRFASAIGLYHASLLIWAYSVVSSSTGNTDSSRGTDSTDTTYVRLDGEDTPQVQRFIVLGIGRPAIGRGVDEAGASNRVIPISDAKQVMLATTVLLRQKNEFEDKGCPPLVDNLSKLMKSLGNAAEGMKRQ